VVCCVATPVRARKGGWLDKQSQVSGVLGRLGRGETSARAELLPLVYEELRSIASALMRQERSNHTLQPTALVHEAYMRLVGQDEPFRNRAHFFGVAAMAMRRVLVDHARRKTAAKRGGSSGVRRLDAPVLGDMPGDRDLDVLALDELLTRLAELDERKASVVELRFFGGMTNEQIADFLGIARSTVAEDWAFARAWLGARLGETQA